MKKGENIYACGRIFKRDNKHVQWQTVPDYPVGGELWAPHDNANQNKIRLILILERKLQWSFLKLVQKDRRYTQSQKTGIKLLFECTYPLPTNKQTGW